MNPAFFYDPSSWASPGNVFNSGIVLALAAFLGAMIGVERQIRQRAVGVRTNALVALGAAVFTLFAALLPNPGADSIARVAAQVVSGIGFLGAGVIMRDGVSVSGLTTAATLWCSAAVGVLVGAHMFELAIMAASSIVMVNLMFRPISKAIDARHKKDTTQISKIKLVISCERFNSPTVTKQIETIVSELSGVWLSCRSEESKHAPDPNSGHQNLLFIDLQVPSEVHAVKMLSTILPDIKEILTFSIGHDAD